MRHSANYISCMANNLTEKHLIQPLAFILLHAAPAKVQVNESVVSSMNKNTTSYFVLDISSRGLTLQLTAKIGALLLYTSCSLSTPNEAFYSWKLFTDATTNIYVSCGTGNSAVLYISVRGYMASNSFAFTAITGDFSTPQRK